MPDSDAEEPDLVAIGRDPDAFESFYRAHVDTVGRFIARRVSDPHTAPPRRRLVAGGVAATLAVTAAVGAAVFLGGERRPAYAAERHPDGSIRIYIREYRDAKGLQARLRQLGVPVVVDYVPNGRQCREPRSTYIPDDQVPRGLITLPPADHEGGAYWNLHPDLIGPGQTLVYTTTIIGDPGDREWSASSTWKLATGPVSGCTLVRGPVRPRNGG